MTTIEAVQSMPGFNNLAAYPIAWLNSLVGAADAAVKMHCQQWLERQAYVEFYNGNLTLDTILRQMPVLQAQTTITAASNGQALPQATINVASTAGFDSGTHGGSAAQAPGIAVQTSLAGWTYVTYTGVTATSFTGCSGGAGTLTTGNGVAAPVVWFDPNGYAGQSANGFKDGTLMVQGNQYIVDTERVGQSRRGLLKRIGGAGAGFVGFYPEMVQPFKLGSTRLPYWPRGYKNIKVAYSAGFDPYSMEFRAISYATAMLAAQMTRIMPSGAPLSSESLGAYTYNVLAMNTDIPEIGSIQRTLAPFRESSWGGTD